MNTGERDEIICKILLTDMRDNHGYLFGKPVESVAFRNREFSRLPNGFLIRSLNGYSDIELESFASHMGIDKSPARSKADVFINGTGISLKSLRASPAALVNHTSRPGFEFACLKSGASIKTLDLIIDDYWKKRIAGIITEDTRTNDLNCPFASYKEYLKPILKYFLFDGTGSTISSMPAEYVIEFSDPFIIKSYELLNKEDAIEKVWPKLVFSLRAKKGMPSDYDVRSYNGPNASSIAKWVRYINGNYRGALHIRVHR